jgi:hypothetical protein
MRRWGRRIVAAVGSGLVIAVLVAQPSLGYTVVGATFSPDHGAPGDQILVTGFGLPHDCPSVSVYLAPSAAASGITSPNDRRLTRLDGAVRYLRGFGLGVGDTRRTTTFSFRVPNLGLGRYSTFAKCAGGSFDPGATAFRITGGDLPQTSTVAPSTAVPDSRWPWFVLTGSLPVGALLLRRRAADRSRPNL